MGYLISSFVIKRKWYIILIVSFALICRTTTANTDEQIWIGYIQQGRVPKHWGYWIDVHHRTKNDFLKNLHANIIRAGATYYLNDHWRFTIGHSEIIQFPSLSNQRFIRPEHRPWQQVFHTITKANLRLINYLRSEQRLISKTSDERLVNGVHFRQRLRYNVMLMYVLNRKKFKEGSWGIVINNEIFVNAYSSDKVPAYDQNRAFAGLFYHITPQLQAQLGYLNIYALQAKGQEVIHAIRVFFFHNLDWRKKK